MTRTQKAFATLAIAAAAAFGAVTPALAATHHQTGPSAAAGQDTDTAVVAIPMDEHLPAPSPF
ncbi:hypothetical protein PS467_24625 [Streptomyces luomodiensis]|uniref:Uncharacterized protein n=1 Tax=Streptomyces luomodiensis TaxID=3026192 RepID=A0ABY9V0A2_9ACTN|nr:hypothetical protein [Streptomyces sp. SCA4-21]WNE98284.1 hypothetical protein PS467_24625 [Streptomyces sp. SCA4-21]